MKCKPVRSGSHRDGRARYTCQVCHGMFFAPEGEPPEFFCPLETYRRLGLTPGRAGNPLPLGDWLAKLLGLLGITKDRFARLLGRPCGCDGRQARLNQIGFRLACWLRLR